MTANGKAKFCLGQIVATPGAIGGRQPHPLGLPHPQGCENLDYHGRSGRQRPKGLDLLPPSRRLLIGDNMTASTKKLTAAIEGEYLVIRVPMNTRPTPSSTGKTLVIASSHGNKQTDLEIDGKPVVVGVNAYIQHG
jgi:hypothetical protein